MIKVKWVLDSAVEAENFVWDCIEKIIVNKYWITLRYCLTAGKEEISTQYIIGKAFFTYISIFVGNHYSNHPKNINHVHKYTK